MGDARRYYISRTPTLLKGFEKTAELVKESVISRYGDELAKTILTEARREFASVIPQIPHIDGPPFLNQFLRGTATEISVYKAMKNQGISASEAW